MNIAEIQKLTKSESGGYGIGIGKVVSLYKYPALFLTDKFKQFFRKDKQLLIVKVLCIVYHHMP